MHSRRGGQNIVDSRTAEGADIDRVDIYFPPVNIIQIRMKMGLVTQQNISIWTIFCRWMHPVNVRAGEMDDRTGVGSER
jgi:hypothetical protein